MSLALQGVLERLDELERLLPGLALLYDDPEAFRASVVTRLEDIVRQAPSEARGHVAPRVNRILWQAAEVRLQPRTLGGIAPDPTA